MMNLEDCLHLIEHNEEFYKVLLELYNAHYLTDFSDSVINNRLGLHTIKAYKTAINYYRTNYELYYSILEKAFMSDIKRTIKEYNRRVKERHGID